LACNCGKNRTAPTGSVTNSRKAAQAAADAQAARAANAATRRIGPETPKRQTSGSGETQTFALRTGDGRTQSFGSLLEVRAAQARHGGVIQA
jgi:hypothetical protein